MLHNKTTKRLGLYYPTIVLQTMNVSEVMDIEGSFTGSEKLEAGQKITIQGLHVKYVDGVGACLLYTSPSPRD